MRPAAVIPALHGLVEASIARVSSVENGCVLVTRIGTFFVHDQLSDCIVLANFQPGWCCSKPYVDDVNSSVRKFAIEKTVHYRSTTTPT